ncbi:nuclease-related domain-containing protein [Fictibacillus enclensis]|uniref:nuclease-related domain-containing protein n=1 Tax=Fictibacillus enclensis TaxID=1017270 RepID=UPI0025A096D8|nr:nuclease-related domain-containing protein [Fictibacillus enclensis]MDM5340020.1 nuclease-related domain-containing protein [Fictibacillus enclensis]
MIIKPLLLPLSIKKLKALQRRLAVDHPKRPLIEKELAQRMKGYRGELSLDFYLQHLPQKDYLILHDIRLPGNFSDFQMDLLVLSPFFVLNLEIKNISGSLLFDETHQQLIRSIEGKEEGFSYPMIQIKRQEQLFKEWMSKNRCPIPPLISLIVISSPQTIFRTKGPSTINRMITRSALLPEKIDYLNQIHTQQIFNKRHLKRLSHLLIEQHQPESFNPLERFKIMPTELLTGVHCSSCFFLPLKRKRGKWFCAACLHYSSDAHIPSLEDYYLLFQPTITNQQCRQFLQLNSRDVVKHLLTALNLPTSGSTKGTVYHLSELES